MQKPKFSLEFCQPEKTILKFSVFVDFCSRVHKMAKSTILLGQVAPTIAYNIRYESYFECNLVENVNI